MADALTQSHRCIEDVALGYALQDLLTSLVQVPDAGAGAGASPSHGLLQPQKQPVFFRVAEKNLRMSTFLGSTTMAGVDFFAQKFDLVSYSKEYRCHADRPQSGGSLVLRCCC